jgi:hypothetical protein
VTQGRGGFTSAEYSLKPIGENSIPDHRRQRVSSPRRKSKPVTNHHGMTLPDVFSKEENPIMKEALGGSMGPLYKSINKKIGSRLSPENSKVPRETLMAGQLLLNIINKPLTNNGLTQFVKKSTLTRSLSGENAIFLSDNQKFVADAKLVELCKNPKLNEKQKLDLIIEAFRKSKEDKKIPVGAIATSPLKSLQMQISSYHAGSGGLGNIALVPVLEEKKNHDEGSPPMYFIVSQKFSGGRSTARNTNLKRLGGDRDEGMQEFLEKNK